MYDFPLTFPSIYVLCRNKKNIRTPPPSVELTAEHTAKTPIRLYYCAGWYWSSLLKFFGYQYTQKLLVNFSYHIESQLSTRGVHSIEREGRRGGVWIRPIPFKTFWYPTSSSSLIIFYTEFSSRDLRMSLTVRPRASLVIIQKTTLLGLGTTLWF